MMVKKAGVTNRFLKLEKQHILIWPLLRMAIFCAFIKQEKKRHGMTSR